MLGVITVVKILTIIGQCIRHRIRLEIECNKCVTSIKLTAHFQQYYSISKHTMRGIYKIITERCDGWES